MAILTMRGLSDRLYERLTARAEANRRSLNAEVLVCLEEAVGLSGSEFERLFAGSDAVREGLGVAWYTESDLSDVLERARVPTDCGTRRAGRGAVGAIPPALGIARPRRPRGG